MKKILCFLFFIPSLLFADRLGSLKSNAEVLLTTQAISGATLPLPPGDTNYIQVSINGALQSLPLQVSSATIKSNDPLRLVGLSTTESSLYTNMTPLPRSGGIGPQTSDLSFFFKGINNSGFGGEFDLFSSTQVPATFPSLPLSYSQFRVVPPVNNTPGSIYFTNVTNAANNSPFVVIGSSINIQGDVISNVGNPISQPQLTSCGSSPSISANSSDFSGTITIGGSATGCTLTFANAFSNKPTCIISNQSLSLTSSLSYVTSLTSLTLSQAVGLSGDLIDYNCIGH